MPPRRSARTQALSSEPDIVDPVPVRRSSRRQAPPPVEQNVVNQSSRRPIDLEKEDEDVDENVTLPIGLIDDLFTDLMEAPGGDDIIESWLNSYLQFTLTKKEGNANNNRIIKTLSPLIVLQTITRPEPISEHLLLDLIFATALPNLTVLYLGLFKTLRTAFMKWMKDDSNEERGDFGQILSKMPNLTSLVLDEDEYGTIPSPFFDRTIKKFTLEKLETFNILSNGVTYESMENLCTNAHFPNLSQFKHSTIWIDEQKTNRSKGHNACTCQNANTLDGNIKRHDEMGKMLVKWIERMPGVVMKDYFSGCCPITQYKKQFFQHFVNSPILSNVISLDFPGLKKFGETHSCGDPIENRQIITTSPHLTNITEVTMIGTNETESKEFLTQLFNQSWANKITSITLNNFNFDLKGIAELFANQSLSSRLNNLTKFTLMGQKLTPDVAKAITHSPLMAKITSLTLPLPLDTWSIVAASPQLSQLEEFRPEGGVSSFNSPPLKDIVQAVTKVMTALPKLTIMFNLTYMIPMQCDDDKAFAGLLQIPNLSRILPEFSFYGRQLSLNSMNVIATYGPDALNITKLQVGYNIKEGTKAHAFIKNLTSNPNWSNLTTLDLFSNNLNDDDLKLLSNCPYLSNLTTLCLAENNNITDEGIQALSQSQYLNKLKNLDIRATKMTKVGLEALSQAFSIMNLESLNLRDSRSLQPNDLECLLGDTMLMGKGSTVTVSKYIPGIGDCSTRLRSMMTKSKAAFKLSLW